MIKAILFVMTIFLMMMVLGELFALYIHVPTRTWLASEGITAYEIAYPNTCERLYIYEHTER